MNPRDQADLGRKRADFIELSAVNPLAVVKQPAADDKFLQLIDGLVELIGEVGIFRFELLMNIRLDWLETLLADILVVGVEGFANPVDGKFLDLLKKLGIDNHLGIGNLGYADLGFDIGDELRHLGRFLVAGDNRLHHQVLGNLIGGALNHADLVHIARNSQIHRALLLLLLTGHQHRFTVDQAHGAARDRAAPRNIRDREGEGGANHAADFRRAVGVVGKHRHNDGDIVSQVLGEEGAHRPVHQAGSQNRPVGGTAFPAQEGAGNFAGGIELFLKIDRHWEEVDALAGLFAHGDVHHHCRLAVADDAGTVGEHADFADLKAHGASGELGFKNSVCEYQ